MDTRAVKAILDLTSVADSTGSVEAYHAALLAALSRAFACDVVVFNDFQLGAGADARRGPIVTCTATPPIEPHGAIAPALLGTFVCHMAQHPLIRLHAAGDPRAHRLSDAISMRAFRRGPLYCEFFRSASIAHQLALGLESPPGRLVGVWLNRTRCDFSEDELLVAELLRPHLRAAEVAAGRAVARAALTDRERDVLDLVGQGAPNAAVAEALVISPGTVKKHLDNIYAKLGVGSRVEAAERACTDAELLSG